MSEPEKGEGNIRRVLRERARALAVRPVEVGPGGGNGGRLYLVFDVGPDRYAVSYDYVRTVAAPREIVSLPSAPAWVVGIAHIRGRIVSVLDLNQLLGIEAQSTGPVTLVVVLGSPTMELGIGAHMVGEERIEAFARQGRRFVSGVTEEGVILLDAQAMLQSEKIIVNESIRS